MAHGNRGLGAFAVVMACHTTAPTWWGETGAGSTGAGPDAGPGTEETGDPDRPPEGSSSGDGEEPPTLFDLGAETDGDSVDLCAVEDLDGPPPECEMTAPPETFETPTLEWTLSTNGAGSHLRGSTVPVVANLTDDNDDGTVDLCDVPDIVIPLEDEAFACALYVVDGGTGAVHFEIDEIGGYRINCQGAPALGDIDGDGQVEIVTNVLEPAISLAHLAAIEPDGTVEWIDDTSYAVPPFTSWTSAIALHDVDADGSPEILFGNGLHAAATGAFLWSSGDTLHAGTVGSIALDLDTDGTLEILHGSHVYDVTNAGGTWELTPGGLAGAAPGLGESSIPHVADFLASIPGPEILLVDRDGYLLMTPDGTLPWGETYQRPLEIECDPADTFNWLRPAVVHDFDADGVPELAASACDTFAIYDVTDTGLVELWSTFVDDDSGSSGSTAFDFLSDGTPEPIYSDESTAFVWTRDGGGWTPSLELSRRSPTWIEHPIVVDADNDGSAEILVVSSDGEEPALQSFGTDDDDWTQARRIWNQATYFVTHVSEDGSIPSDPPPHWEVLNTFRANSPIEEGGLCVPAG